MLLACYHLNLRSVSSENPTTIPSKMNFIPRFNTATTLAVVAFASSVSLHGQTVPAKADPPPPPEKKIPVVTETKSDESDEGMIVLSSFVVTAKNDSGYSAGSTLAG